MGNFTQTQKRPARSKQINVPKQSGQQPRKTAITNYSNSKYSNFTNPTEWIKR